jgi:hypothetical protein
LFSFLSVACLAQVADPIKVKKEKNIYLFYQAGTQTDTLTTSSGNLFYLVVSDSLKPFVSLQIENAQLVKTSKDSVYKLVYIYGLNYEGSYQKRNNHKHEDAYEFRCLVNGASTRNKNEIYIRFKIEVRPGSLWEKKFIYKP